jgi:NAD(P)-dependent dehydrogenase (short-subunit alcohol dehydrogenase family)
MPDEKRVAIITGGASGIGRATADLLAQQGYHLVLCDRAGAKEAALAFGAKAEGITLDIADVAAVRRAVAEIVTRHGTVAALVACAGISGRGLPFARIDEAAFDAMMDIHVRGHFFMIQALLSALHAGSAIVLVSSTYARIGHVGMAHYAAAKGALLALAKSLAAELGPAGVRVNAVTPGLVRTPMTEKSAELAPKLFEDMIERTPLRRLATPAEIAATIAYLLSPAAAAMTGQALSPSSGFVMAD